jgi:hypothetical protein
MRISSHQLTGAAVTRKPATRVRTLNAGRGSFLGWDRARRDVFCGISKMNMVILVFPRFLVAEVTDANTEKQIVKLAGNIFLITLICSGDDKKQQ